MFITSLTFNTEILEKMAINRMIKILNHLKDEFKFHTKKDKVLGGKQTDMLFILSPGRSGSTLLRKLLMQEFSIHIPPESSVIIPKVYNYYLKTYNGQVHENFIQSLVDCIGNHEFQYWNIENKGLIAYLSRLVQNNKLPMDKAVFHIYDYHRSLYNPSAKKIGDKTPYLVYHHAEILRIFPNAKIIHLQRDPFAVIPSRMKTFNESLEEATNRWVWSAKEMRKYTSANTLLVRYEDLVQKNILTKVGIWADLEARPTKLDVTQEMLGDTVLSHHKRAQRTLTKNRNESLAHTLSHTQKHYIVGKACKLMKFYEYL